MRTLTPAEVARSYIERFGTPAVPCRGKRSLSKWSKPEGRASTTEEVDPLFNQYPHADGVALLLGGDGLFVVDTDSDAAHLDHETWRKMSSVQETRTHTSPGGDQRRHYWYRAPEGVTPPGKNRKDYGDIKAKGGYVLAPGLESGRQVELDIEPVQLTLEQYEALCTPSSVVPGSGTTRARARATWPPAPRPRTRRCWRSRTPRTRTAKRPSECCTVLGQQGAVTRA